MKKLTVYLTPQQLDRVLDCMDAKMAGDTSEGDLSWTQAEHNTACRAHDALVDAASIKVCAECREPITSRRRVVEAKDGALFHGRCWRSN